MTSVYQGMTVITERKEYVLKTIYCKKKYPQRQKR